ncbi:TPA: hypothetical protein I8235_000009 [Kluyvera intermedia]|nr:hypothetical protein [Kluyvera intermedia]
MKKEVAVLLTNPRFTAVLDVCLEEQELIENFERIYGVTRPPVRRTPIEAMVDEATGFRKSQWEEFFNAFIPFVYDCIWLRCKELHDDKSWCGRPVQ